MSVLPEEARWKMGDPATAHGIFEIPKFTQQDLDILMVETLMQLSDKVDDLNRKIDDVRNDCAETKMILEEVFCGRA